MINKKKLISLLKVPDVETLPGTCIQDESMKVISKKPPVLDEAQADEGCFEGFLTQEQITIV